MGVEKGALLSAGASRARGVWDPVFFFFFPFCLPSSLPALFILGMSDGHRDNNRYQAQKVGTQ